MDTSKKKNNYGELFILFAYILYITIDILAYTQFAKSFRWETVRKITIVISSGTLVIGCVANTNVSHRWIFCSIISLSVGCIIALSNDLIKQTMMIVLFIIAGYFLQTNLIFKWHWITVSILVSVTLILYFLGIYYPDFFEKETGHGTVQRAYLGFSYTTYAPNYLLHLMLSFYAFKKKNITIIDTGIFVLANIILYKLTYTYAVLILSLFLLLVLWMLKIKRKLFSNKLFGFVITIFFPVMAISNFLLSAFYSSSNSFLCMMDKLLSGRLRLGQVGINQYGLKLFGNAVEWVGGREIDRVDEYFYVDSSYINIALTYGIIALIFVVISFSIISYKAYKRGNYKLCIVLMILAMHSFTDPQLMELKYDPFLVLTLAAFIPRMDNRLNLGMKKIPIICLKL